ncbi:MAG: oligoendopeptidase F [Clostridia bacterium]|nr:oligoendopeptidase F [Clostridia bacterium]NCC75272.1 oligoendopeptidase F [Clostridia bacterium]
METPADPPREPDQPGAQHLAGITPQVPFASRSEVPESERWRLEDIFPDDAAWEAAFAHLPSRLSELIAWRGLLADSPENLAAALSGSDLLELECLELLAYARMHRDEDNTQSVYQAMTDRITAFYYQFAEQTAFILPEMAQIDADLLQKWQASTASLADFRMLIDNSIRNRPHTLSEAEEALLSRFGPASEGINDIFSMLDHVEIDLGEFPDEQGHKARLTHGRFAQLREHPDREIRARAFAQVHDSYAKVGRTLATLYATRVKTDIAFSAARRHTDTLANALFADKLPTETVTGLVAAVHAGLPDLYRYLGLRQRLMGLPDLHIYDTYVPLITESQRHFTYSQACDLVKAGLRPLGDDYAMVLERHLSDRWIDVHETPGKTTGAYSWGTYRTHPYVLLNFSGMQNDVFTLAHEVGHSLHTYFSSRQPFALSHYPIFLAEIASTVNENLLLQHLMDQCDTSTPEGRLEKIALLNHFLEEFRLTVFRQTMFCEFELKAHQAAEAGQPLTSEVLTDLYRDLLVLYFGPGVVIDPFMHWEWSRIPHFYNAYYVFKYATGFSAAVALSRHIRQEGETAVSRYLTFLGSGGSGYPLDLLKQAGVDLSTAAPVQDALTVFAKALDELEHLLASITGSSLVQLT